MLKFGHQIGKHRAGQDDQVFIPLSTDKREMGVISNFTGTVHDSRENGMSQENRQWPGWCLASSVFLCAESCISLCWWLFRKKVKDPWGGSSRQESWRKPFTGSEDGETDFRVPIVEHVKALSFGVSLSESLPWPWQVLPAILEAEGWQKSWTWGTVVGVFRS